MRDLRRIVSSAAAQAKACGVSFVTGDTKVVPRGKGDGVYLNTAGVGECVRDDLGSDRIRCGDAVLVSGDVGRHGIAVMLARHELGLFGELQSDCAPLTQAAQSLRALAGTRVMRDPTRGGLATTLCEFAKDRPFSLEIDESAVPIDAGVRAACEMLGIDPLYSACEGRLVAVVSQQDAPRALEALRACEGGQSAAVIGRVRAEHPGCVVLRTPLGTGRLLTRLTGAQLPRIC